MGRRREKSLIVGDRTYKISLRKRCAKPQGEAFTLASISYLAILVKYILAKKKKKKKKKALGHALNSDHHEWCVFRCVVLRTFYRLKRGLVSTVILEIFASD